MKVYIVSNRTIDRNGWSIDSDYIEKVFLSEESAKSYMDSKEKESSQKYNQECYNRTIYLMREYDVEK